MKRSILIFSIVILLFMVRIFFAATIGSDTAVTRFNSQQTLNNGDRVAGFAWLAGGFALSNAAVSATFDSIFPVLGMVDFLFGTLVLNQDLILDNVTQLVNWGNFIGNNHVVSLPAQYTCFPSTSVTGSAGTAQLTCSVVSLLNQTTHGTSINDIAWDSTSQYISSAVSLPGPAVPLGAMYVDTVPLLLPGANVSTDFTNVPGTYDAIGASTVWHPFKLWACCGLGFSALNFEEFIYNFVPPIGPFNAASQLGQIDIPGGSGGVFTAAWHPTATFMALGESPNANSNAPNAGENRTLEIYAVSSAGVFGATAATQDFSSKNQWTSVDFNVTGSALIGGTQTGGGLPELRLYNFSLTGPTLGIGGISPVNGGAPNVTVTLGTQVNCVAFNKNPSMNNNLIAVGVNPIAAAPVNNNGLLIYKMNQGAGTLTQVATGFKNISVTFADWNQTSSCLVVGTAASYFQVYNYNDSSNVLTLQYSIPTSAPVTRARFSPNGTYIAVGDTSGVLSLYGPTPSIGLFNLFMIFNGNSTLNTPGMKFSGTNVINGNKYVINFAPSFALQVLPNSSLLLKDVVIKGMSAGQLIVDSTSTVSFQDVQIFLDGDYTFSSGRFEVLKNLEITGMGNSFIYTSTQTSLIRSTDPSATTTSFSGTNVCAPGFTGSLIIDQGVTFQYNSTSASNLIQLEGADAQWILNGATLSIANSLQLTKGRLVIDGNSSLDGVGSLIVGDGASAANNLTFEIRPAANLQVLSTLIYRNL